MDCVLMRARLTYLARMLRAQPPALLALLRQRPRGSRSRWLRLISDDMRRLRSLVARCNLLPDPDSDPAAWTQFILSDQLRWKQCVALVHFTDSLCDVRAASPEDAVATREFRCDACGVAFHTHKQLAQHRRIKHGEKCPQRFYAAASGACPVCQTVFGTRLALLSHLCDSRRQRCWTEICRHPGRFVQIPAEEVAVLDALDNEARKRARRQGHSHALATGGCVRADGTPVGRPTT